jgi:hypothetical protein
MDIYTWFSTEKTLKMYYITGILHQTNQKSELLALSTQSKHTGLEK